MGTLTLILSLLFSVQERVDISKTPRSLYLPIRFNVCEHFEWAVLYSVDTEPILDDEGNPVLNEDNQKTYKDLQLLGLLPLRRMFQFTHYPDLENTERTFFRPIVHVVKVNGRVDGEELNHYITILPEVIYLSRQKAIVLDEKGKTARRFTYKRDVRYKEQFIRVDCDKYPHDEDTEEEEKEGTS